MVFHRYFFENLLNFTKSFPKISPKSKNSSFLELFVKYRKFSQFSIKEQQKLSVNRNVASKHTTWRRRQVWRRWRVFKAMFRLRPKKLEFFRTLFLSDQRSIRILMHSGTSTLKMPDNMKSQQKAFQTDALNIPNMTLFRVTH